MPDDIYGSRIFGKTRKGRISPGMLFQDADSPGRAGETAGEGTRKNPTGPIRHLMQRSPTILAPRTGFMEDKLSMDQGGGRGFKMIQEQCIQTHLLLCGPVPNRPRSVPVFGPEVEDPCDRVRCGHVILCTFLHKGNIVIKRTSQKNRVRNRATNLQMPDCSRLS